MNEHRDLETEAMIRRALEARAGETSLSPDALEAIHNRRIGARWARPVAYGAAAAIVVLIAGIAILNSADDDLGQVDSVATTSSTVPPDSTTSTGPPEPSTSVSADEIATANRNGLRLPLPTSPQVVATAGLELWRDDDISDPEQLATEYARTQLGIDDPALSPTSIGLAGVGPATDLHPFGVHRRTESGEISDAVAFTIVVYVDERGPAVTHVLSDAFRVDLVEHNTADTVRVTGAGTAFEGTAVLRTGDTETLLSVGGVDLDEFSVIVPTPSGADRVTLVIEGTTVFDGEVPEISAYVAVPIPRQTTSSVFGVADDDMLNVRSGAGVENDVIATLAPDAVGLVPTGREEFIGDERWWEIETEAGLGWVNRRFLVVTRSTSGTPGLDDQLLAMVQTLPSFDDARFAERVEIGGIGVFADWPTPWTSIARDEFDSDHQWSPEGTEDRTCDCDLTVPEFLGFDTARWYLARYEVPGPILEAGDPGVNFQHGQTPEFFDRFTTGSIYIPEPEPQESLDWRRYTVVFDFEDGTPVIRGIWRWGWTP
jgi:hypothetical protein